MHRKLNKGSKINYLLGLYHYFARKEKTSRKLVILHEIVVTVSSLGFPSSIIFE